MPPENDDNFDTFWEDERDWLVMVVALDEDCAEELDWIGRLGAYAGITQTRVLALVSDPIVPTYEIWFSFYAPEGRAAFREFVRHDGFIGEDWDSWFDTPETFGELRALRPLWLVFPEDQQRRIDASCLLTVDVLSQQAE